MKRAISLFLLLGLALVAQSQKPADVEQTQFYSATYEVTLSGSPVAFTVQLPASANRRVYLQGGMVYCSVDCVVQQERNGTAATTTAGVSVPLNTTLPATAIVYTNSNVGVGSLLPKFDVKAGQFAGLDLSFSTFQKGASGAQNYTLRPSATTGTIRFSIFWGER